MLAVRLTWLAAALIAVAGCGRSKAPPHPAPTATHSPAPQPALCGRLSSDVLGRVTGPTELSGLVLARGRFWTLNDSGGTPQVFAIDRDGELTQTVTLAGATNVDWEDIAARGPTLYVGDIGDNLARRESIAVYRLAAPPPGTTTATATRIDLRYPDQPHDAETLLVDPRTGTLAVVTKHYGGLARVYVGRKGTLKLAAKLQLGLGEALTGGDVSADGATVALRSYDRVFIWPRRPGETLARAFKRKPCTAPVNLIAEGQGEALALAPNGRAFYTIPEGENPALRRYAPPEK
ncbi:MAG TPA: hypothetical protein VFG79_06735 [Solirubrobacter sp.]|nr:hypothetical protein [Solirubrobacter sp.]